MVATSSDPFSLLSALRNVLDETERDFTSMPFFIRPMVRRGFASRTGMSLDAWQRLAQELLSQVRSGAEPSQVRERHPRLREALGQLAENYRTAPERASRGMGGGALQAVTASARRREE
ncbi:MAG: hypothetical protein JXB05_07380, partial [Myxococcaceae bacterium]|nr:hypothetical protein [Myxococcaceae bacterium]